MNNHIKAFQELSNEEMYSLLKARTDVFVVEQKCPYPELDNYDQVAMHCFFEEDGEIVANVRILPSHSRYPEASIGRVLVVKKYRNQGYARMIMEKAMTYIQTEWNNNKIKIQAQVYLEPFYSSLGFERITDNYLEDDIPHVDMIWKQK